jgi:hypothetical protein
MLIKNKPPAVIKAIIMIHNHDFQKSKTQFWCITIVLKFLKENQMIDHRITNSLLILS